MATGFTNFSGDTVGQVPSGFSELQSRGNESDSRQDWLVAENEDAPSGKIVRLDDMSGQVYDGGLFWDDAGDIQDGEVVALIRGEFTLTSHVLGIAVRASDDFPFSAVTAHLYDVGGDRLYLGRLTNKADNNQWFPNLVQEDAATQTLDDVAFWVRLNFNDTSYKVKRWLEGDDEPGSWDIETTNSNPTTDSGRFGVFAVNSTALTYRELWALGYSDDPAESAPLTGGGGAGGIRTRGRDRITAVSPRVLRRFR